MRVALLAPLLLLTSSFLSPAAATVSSTVREVTASIPCSGKLVEHFYEGGDFASFMTGVTLVCEAGPHHAHWMLEAGVSCNARSDNSDDDEKNMSIVCGGKLNEPGAKFLPDSESLVHHYDFVRYIFATNCDEVTYRYKTMEAVTNKVDFSLTNSGWTCKDISLVSGIGGEVGGAPGPFRFVPVTVSGGAAQDTNEDSALLKILGVDESAAIYSVHMGSDNKPVAN